MIDRIRKKISSIIRPMERDEKFSSDSLIFFLFFAIRFITATKITKKVSSIPNVFFSCLILAQFTFQCQFSNSIVFVTVLFAF